MTGGQAAVRTLVTHGVTDFFGLPGVQSDWLYNAIYDEGVPFNVYTTRHEQGAAYMALGYALTSGRVGVMSVVPGPGLLNAATGMATAYGLSTPMVCLVGQIPSPFIDKGFGFLHEIVDQPGIARAFTKSQTRATSPHEVSPLIAKAFRDALTGDPRPTMVEVPPDVLQATEDLAIAEPLPIAQPAVDPAELERAVALIDRAHRPLIVVGGGAHGAAGAVRRLAERIQAPVAGHRRGRGVLDSRHPLSVPYTVAHGLWPEVDVVIAIGTRLMMQLHDWGTDPDLAQVWINPDPEAARRIGRPTVSLVARAEEVLPELLDALPERPRDSIADELAARRRLEVDRIAPLEPQLSYIAAIRAALGEDGILITDLTQVGYVMRAAFDVYAPRTFVFPGYPGTLGYGFAAALGAKVANPDRTVLSTVGDGGFMFTAAELATAVKYGIETITVLFDDAKFGNVQLMQREVHDGRVHATDLVSPDFVAMAEAFGAAGLRADSPESLQAAIERAQHQGGPTIIVVPQGTWPNPWPYLATGRVRD